jgi:hypothetical protein
LQGLLAFLAASAAQVQARLPKQVLKGSVTAPEVQASAQALAWQA